MLYPKMNACRDVYNLNGVWQFKTVTEEYQPKEMALDTMPMAVPSSMNELVADKKVKNHVGKVLYECFFSVPIRNGMQYFLRIGATSHKCEVYLNGKKIGNGFNGFYPLDFPLEKLEENNRLSVVIDNRCTFQNFPVGQVVDGKQIINYDFYNFTGIHRDVLVYAVPEKHIDDIVIKTVVDGDYSKIQAIVSGNYETVRYAVLDKERKVVAESNSGEIFIKNPKLWSCEFPYLYTLAVKTESDYYEERFGIRKVEVKGNQFLLNDKPVYFKGFGMHEDFFLTGKGNCTPVSIRNFECLKWVGANSFRTSHYPYSEEIMNLADEYGYMVIDELPTVGMNWWAQGDFTEDTVNDKSKEVHKELIKQLYARDKNHPCVVMYSLSNEPGTDEENSVPYFEDVFAYARTIIKDLPLTLVEMTMFEDCKTPPLADVICLNRYYGWYTDHGNSEVIYEQMKVELKKWYDKYQKPIFITEFGADTIEGNHSFPAEAFSEEYQVDYLSENCRAFDEAEYVIGEHVWNFADFKTKQGVNRVRGNRKGVFTKDRQPKLAAHFLRTRWKNK